MFRVELSKALWRVRTWVFAAGLALMAVLPAILLSTSSDASGGPAFFDQVRHNGLFGSLAALGFMQPFALPLGTGLLSGEAIATEASGGTLRYLLVRPVGRRRLIVAKYLSVLAQVGAAVLWVMIVGAVAGGIAFGFGPFATLSGTTISTGAAALRILAAGGYVLAGVAGVAAIGMLISTLTTSGPGATAGTVAIALASQILDNLSSLRAVHPFLPTHGWLAYVDLFRSPVELGAIGHGLVLFAAYTAIFLGATLVVFSRRDVVS
jgi:ABC-2 type transport system permease protein